MARVYRHTYTKGLPNGQRVTKTCAKWYIEYVDASGRPRRKVGYTDKRATEAYAAELQRRVDREKAGIIDSESLNLSKQLGVGIETHIEAYRLHLRTADVSDWHLTETMRRLKVIVETCGFARLVDLKAEPVQKWCELQESEGMSARTRNTYTGSLRAFVRWCVADRRLAADPLVTLGRADETADKRRNRRALSEDELIQLVTVAELRPLAEYGRPAVRKTPSERQGKRDTWCRAALTPGNMAESVARARKSLKDNPTLIARSERTGHERALIYRTLVLTGLRRGELAALTWGDLSIDTPDAWLTVRAAVAKNRREDAVPVRADLAADLRAWRAECGGPLSTKPVFKVRRDLGRILKSDLEAAGIDATGVDVHSLRHTTATYLAKAGVAPRTAQAIMRHSDIRLTFGVYTDPKALHPAAALEALPSFSPKPTRERVRATGTYNQAGGALGAQLGGKTRPATQSGARACAVTGSGTVGSPSSQPSVSSALSNATQRDSTKRATRLELVTFSLEG